jgi:hypothetical protein
VVPGLKTLQRLEFTDVARGRELFFPPEVDPPLAEQTLKKCGRGRPRPHFFTGRRKVLKSAELGKKPA